MKDGAVRIMIVDDQALYREGLRAIVEQWDDFKVVGAAANGKEAVELCRKCRPDVVLMDVNMPEMDGIEAVRLIHENQPEVAIVMLSVEAGDDSILQALYSGARGYLMKDLAIGQLRDGVREVLQGGAALSGYVAARLLEEMSRVKECAPTPSDTSLLDTLSEREVEILRLACQGLTNTEIGRELCVSEGTIKKQFSSLLYKLDLENRVQAVAYAVRAGLAEPL